MSNAKYKSRERISPSFFVLLLAIALFLDGERLCKAIGVRNSDENGVCDNGRVKIVDLIMLQSKCCVSMSGLIPESFNFCVNCTVAFD